MSRGYCMLEVTGFVKKRAHISSRDFEGSKNRDLRVKASKHFS